MDCADFDSCPSSVLSPYGRTYRNLATLALPGVVRQQTPSAVATFLRRSAAGNQHNSKPKWPISRSALISSTATAGEQPNHRMCYSHTTKCGDEDSVHDANPPIVSTLAVWRFLSGRIVQPRDARANKTRATLPSTRTDSDERTAILAS